MAKESKKLVKCPCCLRDFQSIEDYPIIKITSVERTEIPEYVGSAQSHLMPEKKKGGIRNEPLPEKVRKFFRKTEKEIISIDGIIYKKLDSAEGEIPIYNCSEDLTAIFREAMGRPEIITGLEYVEGYSGKIVETRRLFLHPAFSSNLEVRDFRDVGLSINADCIGEASIYLTGGGVGGFMSFPALWQEVAKIKYEGRIISG